MSPACEEERLAAAATFGVNFISFERLSAGNSSRNFRAVTQDGKSYFVKFAPERDIERAIEKLSKISSPLIPTLAFGGKSGKFASVGFFATNWAAEGKSIPPDEFTEENISSILEAYSSLSAALQAIDPDCLGAWDGLEEEARKLSITPKTIHGDFHYKNFFFRNGKVSAVFDLECIRRGLETDDLLRIFIHALERTPFYKTRKRQKIKENFAKLVAKSPYPRESFLASLKLYERHKIARRKAKSRSRILFAIENYFRTKIYRSLERIIKS